MQRTGFVTLFALAIALLSVTADASDLGAAISDAIQACIMDNGQSPPHSDSRGVVIPGIGRPPSEYTASILSSAGHFFVYRGTGSHEIVCGAALYGDAPQGLLSELALAAQGFGFQEQDKSKYSLDGPRADRERYFGDKCAPALRGVLLLERAPSKNAPSLQMDYHVTLLR